MLEVISSSLRKGVCVERTNLCCTRPGKINSVLNRVVDDSNWLRACVLPDEVVLHEIGITDISAIVGWNGILSSVAVYADLVVVPGGTVSVTELLQQVSIRDPVSSKRTI